MSHPVVSGKKPFTAFRGSIRIESAEGAKEVHVGLKSGESLALADLLLEKGQINPVKISVVYPADATPGHLLSVVPVQQLAMLHRRKEQQRVSQKQVEEQKGRKVNPKAPPPELTAPPKVAAQSKPKPAFQLPQPLPPPPPPPVPAIVPSIDAMQSDAIRTQQQWLRTLQGR
jgi:hypothetical protein